MSNELEKRDEKQESPVANIVLTQSDDLSHFRVKIEREVKKRFRYQTTVFSGIMTDFVRDTVDEKMYTFDTLTEAEKFIRDIAMELKQKDYAVTANRVKIIHEKIEI